MPECRELLLAPTADISVPLEIMRFIGVDVNIARGILMFIWGEPNAEVPRTFISPHG